MSAEDPRPELDEIIARSEAEYLPEEAGQWAQDVYETTEGILQTIDSMQSNGVDAPTEPQRQALRNIYEAACRWLHREPDGDM